MPVFLKVLIYFILLNEFINLFLLLQIKSIKDKL